MCRVVAVARGSRRVRSLRVRVGRARPRTGSERVPGAAGVVSARRGRGGCARAAKRLLVERRELALERGERAGFLEALGASIGRLERGVARAPVRHRRGIRHCRARADRQRAPRAARQGRHATLREIRRFASESLFPTSDARLGGRGARFVFPVPPPRGASPPPSAWGMSKPTRAARQGPSLPTCAAAERNAPSGPPSAEKRASGVEDGKALESTFPRAGHP